VSLFVYCGVAMMFIGLIVNGQSTTDNNDFDRNLISRLTDTVTELRAELAELRTEQARSSDTVTHLKNQLDKISRMENKGE